MEVQLLLEKYKNKFYNVFEFIEEMVKMKEPLVERIDVVITFIIECYNIDVETDSIDTILGDMYRFYTSFDYRFNNKSTGILKSQLKNKDKVLNFEWFDDYKAVMLDEEITENKEVFLNSMNDMKQKLLNLNYSVGVVNAEVLAMSLLKLRD